jgi:adenosylcobinamide-GDP ribazoletransferase
VVAAATAVGSAIILGGIGGAGMLAGATVLAWLMGRYVAGMLGGLTGDSYGAINEVVEAVALMAAVALAPHGWIEPLPDLLW